MKRIRYDNIAPIADQRVAGLIKSVTDQMEPKGRFETQAERDVRLHVEAAEKRHRARRRLRLLAIDHTIDWLNKKPRR